MMFPLFLRMIVICPQRPCRPQSEGSNLDKFGYGVPAHSIANKFLFHSEEKEYETLVPMAPYWLDEGDTYFFS